MIQAIPNLLLKPPTLIHPTRKRETSKPGTYGNWTPEEDQLLLRLAYETPKKKHWQSMSVHFVGKTPQQIMNRWNKVINPSLVKGNWTPEEDEILTKWINEHGERGWSKVAALLEGRIAKQCRERWMNCLKPDIKKTQWTEEEDNTIIRLQKEMGNKWAQMSQVLVGRTDNQIKNRWNSVLKKRLPSTLLTDTHHSGQENSSISLSDMSEPFFFDFDGNQPNQNDNNDFSFFDSYDDNDWIENDWMSR